MTQRKHSKIWRATKSSPAGVMVQEKAAFLIGNRSNFVVADDGGVNITGSSITLNTGSENIRKGGLWVEGNNIVQMIPTTLVTPMPANTPWPPLGLISGVVEDIPFFLSILNGFTNPGGAA